MAASLSRVILYVHDVDRLSAFYREACAGPLCDGRDPEGNVFQLSQATPHRD